MRFPKSISKEEVARLKRVKAVYDKSMSLAETGKKLSLSRERVRQLLTQGSQAGLFTYEPKRKKQEREARKKQEYLREYSKMVRSLGYHPGFSETRKRKDLAKVQEGLATILGGIDNVRKLLPEYKVKLKKRQFPTLEQRKQRCIKEYNQARADLGHYPSSTELSSEKKGNALYVRIRKIWGSFVIFKSDIGAI